MDATTSQQALTDASIPLCPHQPQNTSTLPIRTYNKHSIPYFNIPKSASTLGPLNKMSQNKVGSYIFPLTYLITFIKFELGNFFFYNKSNRYFTIESFFE